MKKPKRSNKSRIKSAITVFFLLAALIGFGFYSSKYCLSISHYTVDIEKLQVPIRIVQLSDLHNSRFGKDNARLIKKISAEQPDLVFITGDVVDQNNAGTDIAVDLVRKLNGIAPVYVSLGNHETAHQRKYETDFRALYTDAGAIVLEYDYTDIRMHGETIRLGGLYGFCLYGTLQDLGEARESECIFLHDFQSTDSCSVLLCHLPICWLQNDSLDAWDVDVVFSGHAHGGQIRIPFVGGLWAPDQGWFPGKESGLYSSKDGSKTLVLSRGLGSTEKIPRFNNIPEIVVVDLK